MEFHSHEIFDDRYVLKEQLGRGSFGEVWLAHDTIAGIDVAIKIYIALDNRGLADFRNEYQSVYEVEHPNILKPMHIDVWNRQPYLVMHYCPTSCESLIGQVSEDEIWRFIEDVSSGLSYLHGHDIIHRDIKPDNILRDPHGNYLLTDFGMSKRLRSSLRRNSTRAQQDEVSGSLSYMGPELFESKPEAVKATDIWALGVTIYEMLTGELPFLGQGGVMQKNGADVPELPETYSYGLRKLVYDCLQKNPWERPMASKLIDYKGLKGPGPETPKKQIINSRLIKGGIFGLSAILLVGLVFWWNGRHREGDPQEGVVTEIRLDRTSLSLEEGDADTLLVTYFPSDATETITAWESGNTEVAIVDNSGKVTAKKSGTTMITAKCNGHTSTCTVEVTKPLPFIVVVPEAKPVTKIALSKTSLSLEEGKSETLKVTYTPSDATDKTTTWESNNTSVATVDKNGKVTAKKAGAASITAVCNGHTSTCTVAAPQPSTSTSSSSSSAAATGTSNGHEWVDLGLSVKWATCNVGASSPSDYGNYYAWGETSPKSDYSWSTLKYCSDTTGDSFTKYNTKSKYGTVDKKTRLDMSDDAARQNWGGKWRMPTDAEWTELREKCTWTWTTRGGHNGYKVTSKQNGNSIFLSAAGGWEGMSLGGVGVGGSYWSSSLDTDVANGAWLVFFNSSDVIWSSGGRFLGLSVRPVSE